MVRDVVSSLQSGIYSFPHFSPHALAAFSNREFDASKDLPSYLEKLEIGPERFATVNQVHGSGIVLASEERKGELDEGDALVTNRRNLALVIRTADCVPLFLLDDKTRSIGLVHVGWKGARKGIVRQTVEELNRKFGVEASTLEAAIGPAIRACCYEVGEEFEAYFPGFVRRREGRRVFDLAGWVKRELREVGLPEHSVSDSNLCTACSTGRFFSARREGQETGRMLSVLMLK